VEKLFFVHRTAFDPAPNVDSAVIKLSKKDKELELKDKDLFFKLVQDSFRMKRKNLRNNLKGYNLDVISKVLDTYGLDLTVRAEAVTLQCFVDMSNELSK
jgi:16S rRNA (adenine1518-N6/adenine1519-N6)-dimethyltransferase